MAETDFTPVAGLVGGLLIGLAAVLLLAMNGRIAGISGILGGSLFGTAEDRSWRTAFLLGLLAGPWLAAAFTGGFPAVVLPSLDDWAAWPLMIAGGLLVGFGTAMGRGCTSGHGVCGLARGSKRSIAATAVFFATAIVTVIVVRHVIGG